MNGVFAPRMKALFAVRPGKSSTAPVGITLSLTGRYLIVVNVASVPSMVVLPLRLK